MNENKQNDFDVQLIKRLCDEKKYKEAFTLVQKAVDEGNARATNYLGILYEEGTGVDQDINKAIELYRQSAQMGYANAYNNLGRVYIYNDEVRDYELGLQYYKRLTELQPENVDVHAKIANVYWDIEDYDNAAKSYKVALQLEPDNPELNFLLARLLETCFENYDDAVLHYSKAIEHYTDEADDQPNRMYAHINLGLIYTDVYNEYNKAEKHYKYVIESSEDPEELELALYNMGCLFQKQMRLDEARDYFMKTLEINTASLDALYNIGVSYYQEKDYKKAKQYFRKAIDIESDYEDANNGYEVCMEALGDEDGAAQHRLNRMKVSIPPEYRKKEKTETIPDDVFNIHVPEVINLTKLKELHPDSAWVMNIADSWIGESMIEDDDPVYYFNSDVVINGNLNLDSNSPVYSSCALIFVNGDLTISGVLENCERESGIHLGVTGKFFAETIIAGGSHIYIDGGADIKYLLYGHYNDGSIHIHGETNVPLVINNDHDVSLSGGDEYVDCFCDKDEDGFFVDDVKTDDEIDIDAILSYYRAGKNPLKK